MPSEKTKRQTEGITFRFDSGVIHELKREATEKRINCNTLVSQIVSNHLEWDANASRAGMVSFPRQLLIKLIEGRTDEQIADVALYMARMVMADVTILLRKSYNPRTFMDVIEWWARVSGFPLRHDIEAETHVFVIQHDMGAGWSLYLAKLFEFVFDEIGTKKPEFQTTNNTVVLKVEL